ncbi:hypothetical protein [Roseovarius ramblicola]|uniref:Prophage tail length tape measure protein n=1 Tax=Roseovarius ramblicola TaxID=2022336 RepID=A0ABV5I0G4_9RHOB
MAERQVTIRVKADGSNVVQTFRLMGKEGRRALGEIKGAATGQKLSFDDLNRTYRKTTGAANNFASGSRNVALQLSQVGQQTIATGNFMQSLAIQLPDLALGFGTVGIAAGVVAGVALPLVANALFDTEDKGKALKDQLKELDAATKSYQGAVERLRSPLTDLREEFGENANAARALFDIQRRRAQINVFTGLADTRQSLAAQIGASTGVLAEDVRQAAAEIERVEKRLAEIRSGNDDPSNPLEGVLLMDDLDQLGDIVERIREVREEMGISTQQAGELVAQFAEINKTAPPQDQLDAVRQLTELYFEAASANGELTDEENATLDVLEKLQTALLKVIAGTDQVTSNTGDGARNAREMADEMTRAASEALRFVGNLGTRSLVGLRAEVAALQGGGSRVAGQVARREADIRASGGFQAAMQGPEGLRRQAIEGLQRELQLTREAAQLDERRAEALRDLNETRAGGGAARSLSELNQAARQTDAIIRQAQQAAVGYSDVVAMLDEALRAGKISQEDYNRALEIARDRFSKVGDGARGAQDEFKAFARSALTDIDNIGDALDQLENRFISRGIDGILDGIFPSGKSGGGKGLLGLGGFLGFLDSGGPIRAGEYAVVGERRPEIVTGPANVIGGADTARMMGGGQVSVPIEVNIQKGAERDGVSRRRGPNGQEIIDIAVSDSISGGRQDGALSQRFGTQTKTVRR